MGSVNTAIGSLWTRERDPDGSRRRSPDLNYVKFLKQGFYEISSKLSNFSNRGQDRASARKVIHIWHAFSRFPILGRCAPKIPKSLGWPPVLPSGTKVYRWASFPNPPPESPNYSFFPHIKIKSPFGLQPLNPQKAAEILGAQRPKIGNRENACQMWITLRADALS